MQIRYLGVEDLPPRQDLDSSAGSPPTAPGYVARSRPEKDPFKKPDPPPGMTPVATWHQANHRTALIATTSWGVILVGYITIRLGLGWPRLVGPWVILAATLAGVYWSVLTRACSWGLGWVASGRRWVKTYELVWVMCHTRIGGPRVLLRDSDGRKLSIRIEDLQSDEVMWDYFYAAMLYSVIAGGARTNRRLHLDLHVPYPKSGAVEVTGQGS